MNFQQNVSNISFAIISKINKKFFQKEKLMLKTLLLAGLIFYGGCVVLIQSDMSGQVVLGDTVTENTHPYGSRMQIPGAKVIWGTNWNSVPSGQVRTFIEYFRPLCDEEVTIQINADNKFEVFLDDVFQFSENDWQNGPYTRALEVSKCTKHELKIVVTNYHNGSPAGLIYQLTQDQNCTDDCAPGAYFNLETCECECVQDCDCEEPRSVWYGHPHCSCGCPNRQCDDGYILNEDCQCECVNYGMCMNGQTWDEDQCQCVCQRKHCIWPWEWSQEDCDCVCGIETCPSGYILDAANCVCFCAIDCPPGFHLNEELCRCECLQFDCTWPWIFDKDLCGCSCKRVCPPDYYLNKEDCSCVCEPQVCPPNQVWNHKECRCECLTQQQCAWPWKWNQDQCRCMCDRICPAGQQLHNCECICPEQQKCPPNYIWNHQECRCQCLPRPCPAGSIWNDKACTCDCPVQKCPYNQTWNRNTCSCECIKKQPCGIYQVWNRQKCICE